MGKVIMSGACPLMTVPRTGTPLSTYTEGSIIKINESGSPVEFYVAKHDYEAGLNGAGRTLVVRKDCYDKRQWHSSNVNAYATSTIDSWLNGDYKNLLSVGVRAQIGITRFKYTPGGWDPSGGNPAVGTLERAIFLLSATELDISKSWLNVEGTSLEIASSLQIAYMSGVAAAQWTRSPYMGDTTYACYLGANGGVSSSDCTNVYGSRPAFTLPSTIKIDESGQVIE